MVILPGRAVSQAPWAPFSVLGLVVACGGHAGAVLVLVFVLAGSLLAGLGRPGGGHGEGFAAAPAGFRGQAPGGAACVSSCRVFRAVRMRWLRTTSKAVTNSIRGASPVRRHQPRAMVLAAGSLAVAKPRSAPVRRA